MVDVNVFLYCWTVRARKLPMGDAVVNFNHEMNDNLESESESESG